MSIAWSICIEHGTFVLFPYTSCQVVLQITHSWSYILVDRHESRIRKILKQWYWLFYWIIRASMSHLFLRLRTCPLLTTKRYTRESLAPHPIVLCGKSLLHKFILVASELDFSLVGGWLNQSEGFQLLKTITSLSSSVEIVSIQNHPSYRNTRFVITLLCKYSKVRWSDFPTVAAVTNALNLHVVLYTCQRKHNLQRSLWSTVFTIQSFNRFFF